MTAVPVKPILCTGTPGVHVSALMNRIDRRVVARRRALAAWQRRLYDHGAYAEHHDDSAEQTMGCKSRPSVAQLAHVWHSLSAGVHDLPEELNVMLCGTSSSTAQFVWRGTLHFLSRADCHAAWSMLLADRQGQPNRDPDTTTGGAAYQHFVDVATHYLGMGHFWVLAVCTAHGRWFWRIDGGGNGYERQQRYEIYVQLDPCAPRTERTDTLAAASPKMTRISGVYGSLHEALDALPYTTDLP